MIGCCPQEALERRQVESRLEHTQLALDDLAYQKDKQDSDSKQIEESENLDKIEVTFYFAMVSSFDSNEC